MADLIRFEDHAVETTVTPPAGTTPVSDTFAGDTSYHLYRIDGGSTCGLG